ncbi:hypothetical protein HPB47_015542 [Ixodes persulcatus]|uniref:Uncharacterized protein n=1 Tax=Ixodes persulcatus TaxID=34615 RepID=A0AC60QTC0_IXOPE|nr:hypothetical protein HPB47_015542 [Ixodes persulcatus]
MAMSARPRGGGGGRGGRYHRNSGHGGGQNGGPQKRVVRSREHCARLLGNLSELRDKGKFCDVELLLEGKTFGGHRAVLAASSPYFEALFSSGLEDSQQKSVEIHGIAPSIFEQLIVFIYKGEIQINQENCQDVLSASNMLGLSEVVQACCDFLQKELHPSNCVGRSPAATKRRRVAITAGDKRDICKWRREHPRASPSSLLAWIRNSLGIDVPKSTLSDILREAPKWLEVTVEKELLTRARCGEQAQLEAALAAWLSEVGAKGATLRKILSKYDPEDVYNLGEMGLFYELAPSETSIAGPPDTRDHPRLTLVIMCNATGTDKAEPLVLCGASERVSFGHRFAPSLYCDYRQTPGGAMSTGVFRDVAKRFDRSLRLQGRQAVLLVDRPPPHTVAAASGLANLSVHHLPPRSAAKQPLETGIFTSVKAHYRCDLLRHYVASAAEGRPLAVTLRRVLQMVGHAWSCVSPRKIRTCWRHMGILSELAAQHDDGGGVGDPEDDVPLIELQQLIGRLDDRGDVSAADFVAVDDELETLARWETSDECEAEEDCGTEAADDDAELPLTLREAVEGVSVAIAFLEQLGEAEHLDSLWAVVRTLEGKYLRRLKRLGALSAGIFRFAEMHSCTNLKLEAKRFIERRFTDVIKEDEFYELPKETLQHFLKSEGLSIDSEFQVFEATMRWILHDVRERRPLVFDVLDAVRFPVISQKQLDRYVSDCPDMSLRVALLKLMQDLKHDSRANQVMDVRQQPRMCARKSVYLIGGCHRHIGMRFGEGYSLASADKLDLFRDQWSSLAPMAHMRSGPGTAVLNNLVYVAGGESDCLILDSGEVLDPVTNQWAAIAPMVQPRCMLGMCALDGFLYAVGGWVGAELGDTVEKYDPVADCWPKAALRPVPIANFRVAFTGLIYVIGGYNDLNAELDLVECFNPVTGEWKTLAPLRIRRAYVGLAVLHDHIYAVGGSNDRVPALASVERYSIEEKTPTAEQATVPKASSRNLDPCQRSQRSRPRR